MAFDYEVGIIFAAILAFTLFLLPLRQPMIPVYVLTGLAVGPMGFSLIGNGGAISALSHVALVFLLFLIGIEVDLERLKRLGLTILIAGISSTIGLFAIGWLAGFFLGMNNLACAYIGLIVAFSSTMLAVKFFTESRSIESLHGRIAISILVMQDLLAIFALPILAMQTFRFGEMLTTVTSTAGIVLLLVGLGRKAIFPAIFGWIAKDREKLFCAVIGIAFLSGFFAEDQKLTFGVGTFLAGLAMSELIYKHEIIGDLQPLKSFFEVLFFVSLGLQIAPPSIITPGGSFWTTLSIFWIISIKHIWLLVSLIFLAIIVKPLIMMVIIGFLGYEKNTAFNTGLALGNLSEFGLILAAQGIATQHFKSDILPIIIIATTATMIFSNYILRYSSQIYGWVNGGFNWINHLAFFRIDINHCEKDDEQDGARNVAIIGRDRLGSLIADGLEHLGIPYVLVDFNPDAPQRHRPKNSAPCEKMKFICGNITSRDILDKLNFREHIRTVFTCVPNERDILPLMEHIKRENPNVNVISITDSTSQAQRLYEMGVNYVLVPCILAAQQLFNGRTGKGKLISLLDAEHAELKQMGEDHRRNMLAEIHTCGCKKNAKRQQ